MTYCDTDDEKAMMAALQSSGVCDETRAAPKRGWVLRAAIDEVLALAERGADYAESYDDARAAIAVVEKYLKERE